MTSPFLFSAGGGVRLISKQRFSSTGGSAGGTKFSITPVKSNACLCVFAGGGENPPSDKRYLASFRPATLVSEKYTQIEIFRTLSSAKPIEIDILELSGLKSINYYSGTDGSVAISEVDRDKSLILQCGYGNSVSAGATVRHTAFSFINDTTVDLDTSAITDTIFHFCVAEFL